MYLGTCSRRIFLGLLPVGGRYSPGDYSNDTCARVIPVISTSYLFGLVVYIVAGSRKWRHLILKLGMGFKREFRIRSCMPSCSLETYISGVASVRGMSLDLRRLRLSGHPAMDSRA